MHNAFIVALKCNYVPVLLTTNTHWGCFRSTNDDGSGTSHASFFPYKLLVGTAPSSACGGATRIYNELKLNTACDSLGEHTLATLS